jgi:4-aminobutyrate aminotransferase-like enzyme
MAGIEIVEDRTTKKPAPELGNRISAKMVGLGLSANIISSAAFGGIFRIAPPITISDENLELGLSIIEESFKCSEGSLPLYEF